MAFETIPLDPKHHKKSFDCGKESLDNYIKKQAKQDVKRKLSACFVYVQGEDDLQKVKGYYTLSSSSVPSEHIPEEFKKNFPKNYFSLPTTLIGRLAIDKSMAGKGLGSLLLLDALERSYKISNEIGSFAVIVDPLDEQAVAFYEKFGFILLPDSGKMFIAMKTIKTLFEN